jgi:hypothetical protein
VAQQMQRPLSNSLFPADIKTNILSFASKVRNPTPRQWVDSSDPFYKEVT